MTELIRKALLVCSACILLLGAGCNSNQGQSSTVKLTGAGSSFVFPIMGRWIADFQKSNQVEINYQSIGSGGGIEQLRQGTVDFAASDAALSDEQLKTMPPLIQVPESAGPVCITYNLPSLKEPLKLSPETLAGIFLGTIKDWQDKAIAKDNPGMTLPKVSIVVAHRSESSGTTSIFTNYLDKVSPEWHKKIGKGLNVSWPAGMGGKGSEAVTGLVKQGVGGIGYVELTYASQNNLPTVLIRNKAGKWVGPSAESASAAIAAFDKELRQDVRTPIVDPPASAPDAYPISGLTFLFIPKEAKDPTKGQDLQKFVQYVIASGQASAVELHYAPLPASLQQLDQQLLAGIGAKTGGS
ncbi:MAG TPA: phosphate ABC transporter substrate-binding protein PstS [Candidatus Angelobacter sp.]